MTELTANSTRFDTSCYVTRLLYGLLPPQDLSYWAVLVMIYMPTMTIQKKKREKKNVSWKVSLALSSTKSDNVRHLKGTTVVSETVKQ